MIKKSKLLYMSTSSMMTSGSTTSNSNNTLSALQKQNEIKQKL